MAHISTVHKDGFPIGLTKITSTSDFVGVDFGILRMRPGQNESFKPKGEACWLLIKGKAEIQWNGDSQVISRKSIFDEAPTALHVPSTTNVLLKAIDDCEFAVMETPNNKNFQTKLYRPSDVPPEYRGKGLVQDACLRNVRLVFDHTTRPESNMVVGEVVNFPGRWSSYPPHHHAQPEIYHYRFTLPQGYGHGEEGDDVYKIRNGDTMTIQGGLDHAQVSAPGYGMYYLWIVKHLENNPYLGFEFTEEHRWILDPKNQGWEPPV